MQNNTTHRIIDANINRASEALRVLEEWVRFNCDNKQYSEKLKNTRHEINNTFSKYTNLILSRESTNDVGKEISNNSKRQFEKDIIRANCKRLEEALRVLCEYGQTLGTNISNIEKCRFETYTLEKDLVIEEKSNRLKKAKLYLVTSRDNFKTETDFIAAITSAVSGGVDIVQLREKKETEEKTLALAIKIKESLINTNALFIVNDRLDIALSSGADGVHLGQDDLPADKAREITPPGFLIGLSTHKPEQGERALKTSADYLGVGPVFKTPTKPDYTPAGFDYVEWANKNIKLPWFAIGGIDELNVSKVISKGASRVAVVRAIMNSENPQKTSKNIKEMLLKKEVLSV